MTTLSTPVNATAPKPGRFGRLARVKPWVAIAGIACIGLAGIYAYGGYRYLEAARDTAAARSQIHGSNRVLSGSIDVNGPEFRLQQARSRLEELRAAYDYSESDALLAAIAEASNRAGVTIASITVPEPEAQTLGEMTFQAQPMSLQVQGSAAAIEEFLAAFQANLPAGSITGITFSSESNLPVAHIQVQFYLLPGVSSEAKAAA